MKNTCNIRTVDPKTLSQYELEKINEVTQDMWAHSIGELVQCTCCNKMISKQDVFWHLEKEIYDKTVKNIMEILSISEIPCIECWQETKFIYWEAHVENIKERLYQSQDSFLVLCENQQGEIVGYEEGYVDSLENIFRRELAYHYEAIWLPEIQQRVHNILWHNPEQMFVLSSIGMRNPYSSFFTLFELFKHFAINIPEKYRWLHGISELDMNNNLNFLSDLLGSTSLWIIEDTDLKNKIINTGKDYQSNLIVISDVVEKYKYFLSGWIKNFLKLSKANKA